MPKDLYEHPFITYLINRVTEDRAGRAALRRTLGRAPGEAPEAFRYVVPFLPEHCGQWTEEVYYLVAGLYAYHPNHTSAGNMGNHLRTLAGNDDMAQKRTEARLMAALRAHPEDLPNHLRRLVGILKAKSIPVNWYALMLDLLAWKNEDRRAQKRWANAFWSSYASKEPTVTADEEADPDNEIEEEKE